MAGRPVSSKGRGSVEEAAVAKQLVQSLRGDLNTLSNEARKKYPAVREAAERGGMYLKTRSEARGFSIQVLASSDDVVHPLLFVCETMNPAIVKVALSALQRLIQFNAIPQASVESIVGSVGVVMGSGVEELKVLHIILLLVTSTDVVQGKPLAKVLLLCFKLYGSRDLNVHNTAGVVIRKVVLAMFERLNSFISYKGSSDWGHGQYSTQGQLPIQASDAYLLFQEDICFLTNGDPPAWLSPSLELEMTLGLELLESVLRAHQGLHQANAAQLLTERVCPLVVKLFSLPQVSALLPSFLCPPHSPTTASLLSLDKPTFGLSVRHPQNPQHPHPGILLLSGDTV